MLKESISVYNPQDPLERAIQDSFHEFNDGWLGIEPCKLMAKAISSTKIFNTKWLNNPGLLKHRIRYFFAPYMTQEKSSMVLPTCQLYLPDILENKEINAFLYNPIVFVTTPIAHYLLNDWPIHIFFDMDVIKSENKDCLWFDCGGLSISEQNVVIPKNAILNIASKQSEDAIKKVAVSLVAPGVFSNDQDNRSFFPDSMVWDKVHRISGVVKEIEPGETGVIHIELDDGKIQSISQEDFDKSFAVIG